MSRSTGDWMIRGLAGGFSFIGRAGLGLDALRGFGWDHILQEGGLNSGEVVDGHRETFLYPKSGTYYVLYLP